MVWWKRAGGALDEGEGDDDDAAFVKDGFTVDADAEEDMTTVVALDIDADGDLDVVAAETNKLTWYENDCAVPTAAPTRPTMEPTYTVEPTYTTALPTAVPTVRPWNDTTIRTAVAAWLADASACRGDVRPHPRRGRPAG